MEYRGHQHWRDMSDYIVHFTKDDGGQSAYDAMLSILATGHVEARQAFGCATNVNGLRSSQQSACFSEIPLDMLDRLVERRRSRHGIGFHQATAIARGAGRVWYLDRETPQHTAFDDMMRSAMMGGVEGGDDIGG